MSLYDYAEFENEIKNLARFATNAIVSYRWSARSTFAYIWYMFKRGEMSLRRCDGTAFSSMKGSGVSRESERAGGREEAGR